MVRRLAALALTASLGAAGAVSAQPAYAASAGTATRAVVRAPLADPAPECNGNNGPNCWEYYSWYWTYSNCLDAGRQQTSNDPGRYDDYNCAGNHGAVVWLWLHHRG